MRSISCCRWSSWSLGISRDDGSGLARPQRPSSPGPARLPISALLGSIELVIAWQKCWYFELMRRWPAILCFALAALGLGTLHAEGPTGAPQARRCRPEMARVHSFCIDRWEIRTVDAASGEPLSPFYPPSPKLAASVRDTWLYQQHTLGAAAARSHISAARVVPLSTRAFVRTARGVRGGSLASGLLVVSPRQACL